MGSSHSLPNKNGAINNIAAAKFQDNNDNNACNNSASTFLPCQEDPLLASFERPIKKQHVRFNSDDDIIKNKKYNGVVKRNSFKNPAFDAEDLHNNKRDTIRTAFDSAFQCTSPTHNPTITHREIVETVKPIKLFNKNAHSTTMLHENSDNAILSGKDRALKRVITYLNPPGIGRE